MSKNREKKHAVQVAERKAHEDDVARQQAASEAEHHLVEAPKGTSRSRFIFNLLLVVFLLLIFSITGPMMAALTGGGGPAGAIQLSFTVPGDGAEARRVELDNTQFYTDKRLLARLEPLLPFLLPGIRGTGPEGQLDPTEDFELARFLILEQLAQRAGIYVADSEVAETILEAFGDQPSYANYLAGQGVSALTFEGALRRGLIVRRYLVLQSAVAAEVLTEDVIERWKLGAEEFDFDYVEAQTEDFRADAEQEVPADAELEAWFDALTAFQKRAFMTNRTTSVEVAYFDPVAMGDFAALFERYPRPEDEDPEEKAQNYYNGYSHVRFAKPEPETDEEKAAMEAGEVDRFYSFEEVADQVRREAPIYYSMMDWLADMQLRKSADEVVDLETEAVSLGLAYQRVEPREDIGYIEGEEPWCGRYFFGTVGRNRPGDLATRVAIEEGALVVGKVVEVFEPEVKAFADVRDEVVEAWVDERTPQLAVERLEAVRDAFGVRPIEGDFETTASAEDFRAACEAAGFEVQQRGYDRQYPRGQDRDVAPSEAENYLRSRTTLFGLDLDTVVAAEASRDGKAAYLVRVSGRRDGDPAEMTPLEAQSALTQLRGTAQREFFLQTFSDPDWVRREHNMRLSSEEDTAPDA